MNLSSLKHQFLTRKFQKQLLEAVQNRTISTKVITSVAILTFDNAVSKDEIKNKVEAVLKVRNCKVFSYRVFDKLDEESFVHFTEKDFSWRGEVTNVNLQSFLEQPFDLLISFFDAKNLYLEFATLRSKASFKVGFAQVNNDLFDLEIIEKIENQESFLKEMKSYLKILNKLEN